jgi:glycosyltransferase involved in cell wall biosynthesis
LTGGRSGGAFGRIPGWLAEGFRARDERFDIVFMDGPAAVDNDGPIRAVKLGTQRATRSIGAWTRYLREAQPELCIASPESLAPYALLAARRAEIAVVPWETSFVTFGLQDFPLMRRVTLPWMQRVTYRHAPWVAAVSHDVAADLNARLSKGRERGRYRLVPNPFVPEELRGPEPPPRTASFRLCALGRLTVHKGYDVLIDAVADLAKTGRDIEVLVVGDGPRRGDLERRAAARGVKDRVRFLGAIRRPARVLASSDVFVHPARREGFGIVLLEALSLGVPVVATTCPGGPKDILDGGRYGVLVPPDDATELGAAIGNLQDDEAARSRLAATGRERIRAYEPIAIATLLSEMAGA